MSDPNEKQINDIVSMLDSFMSDNGGHMNIKVSKDGTINAQQTMEKKVTVTSSSDCADGNVACRVPTLFEGMDRDEEDL